MKKIIAVILLLCFTTVGCTGSFALTKKIYNTHRSQPDKWSDEIMFLIFVIVPVYGISTFADAIIFNSIEFWTGDNPVAASNAKPDNKFVTDGKAAAQISYNRDTQQITIASQTAQSENSAIVLEKTDSMVVAKDSQGNVMYMSVKEGNGNVAVYDKDLNLVKNFSAGEIESLKEKHLR